MKITRQEILTAGAQLEQLGNYAFGSKVRYAIRFNLAKFITYKKEDTLLVKNIQAERAAIFEEHGWQSNSASRQFEPVGEEAVARPVVISAVTAFLSEEEELVFRTVTFADTGETVFPANLMPDWMMPLDDEKDEVKAKENGQLAHENAQSEAP